MWLKKNETVGFCNDCIHVKKLSSGLGCGHPSVRKVWDKDSIPDTYAARLIMTDCGLTGKLFESKKGIIK